MIKLSNITKVFLQGNRTIQALDLSLIHILDRVSVPVWPIDLSVRLSVLAWVGRYPTY